MKGIACKNGQQTQAPKGFKPTTLARHKRLRPEYLLPTSITLLVFFVFGASTFDCAVHVLYGCNAIEI
jgi:hypothetical protein